MITRHQRDLGLWACAQWRALPKERWYFNRWLETTSCGTRGCAMGWLDLWVNSGDCDRYRDRYTNMAYRLLGVDLDTFDRLFTLAQMTDLQAAIDTTAAEVADRFEAWIRRQEVAE